MRIRTRLATVAAVLAVPVGTFTAGALLLPVEPQVTTSDRVVRLTAPDHATGGQTGRATPTRPVTHLPGTTD